MLRFATSPTADMNLNNLRVALFNHLIAQEKKEDLIVRIEDTNKEKNIDGKDQEILDTLGLFGISYSQVIYQSESVRFHSAMALQLMHEKKAFSCFCSPSWIEKKQEESQLADEVYTYDDACRNLPAELVIDNTSPFTIRIVKPDNSPVDSFTIMNKEKIPTYDFSSAVDDMLNNISLVIRSNEYIDATPKQEHIRKSLNYDKKIEYVHITTLDKVPSVKHLLEEGFLPQAISNYLISTGNTTPKNIFTLEEAKEWFTLDTLSSNPVLFDIKILREINKEHLKLLDAKELSRYVGFADTEIGELARVYLEDGVATTRELKAKIAPIFSKRDIPKFLCEKAEILKKIIRNAPYFDKYEDFKNYVSKESGLQEDEFLETLCVLLTNAQEVPDIAIVYKYLKNYIGEIVK
ncbi:glutamate--tRNA ligase [Sulfurimonas sp. SAG-AH-194-C20]|nr:glutamate--tRNA ligase family protein [Sulfurimonas sp. SAG-AH-194-C20]MDF1879376.1 glutamate--tRNA ligase [Sulfurimonas sp. SAG-AH-194-C20]